MRIVVAPDKFAGTLSAGEAASAIATGWQRTCPGDELLLRPMADGGPGFLDVLASGLDVTRHTHSVPNQYGAPTEADILMAGSTAYLESAQVVGLHLTDRRDPEVATSAGIGHLISHAIDLGATHIVVGLGGTATNDGGAGLLAALGATSKSAALNAGPAGLAGITDVDLQPALDRLAGVTVVAATDVDSVLTGLFGATKTFGPQKGLAEDRLPIVDGWLQEWAAATDKKIATKPGTGAAGGIGFALQLLGATRVSGFDVVAEAIDLAQTIAAADLVITGEGAFDFSSRAGKVPYGVAHVAAEALRPCIALAGQVLVGSREMRALGIESAYSVVDLLGEERAFGDPAGALADLSARVARTWGGRRTQE